MKRLGSQMGTIAASATVHSEPVFVLRTGGQGPHILASLEVLDYVHDHHHVSRCWLNLRQQETSDFDSEDLF